MRRMLILLRTSASVSACRRRATPGRASEGSAARTTPGHPRHCQPFIPSAPRRCTQHPSLPLSSAAPPRLALSLRLSCPNRCPMHLLRPCLPCPCRLHLYPWWPSPPRPSLPCLNTPELSMLSHAVPPIPYPELRSRFPPPPCLLPSLYHAPSRARLNDSLLTYRLPPLPSPPRLMHWPRSTLA